jgi:isovaleryl-CoA dehydrogenase
VVTSSPSDYSHALDSVLEEEVVVPNADAVDRSRNVSALDGRGLLALLSSPEVGGAGQGLPAAAQVIERLAGACGRPRWWC